MPGLFRCYTGHCSICRLCVSTRCPVTKKCLIRDNVNTLSITTYPVTQLTQPLTHLPLTQLTHFPTYPLTQLTNYSLQLWHVVKTTCGKHAYNIPGQHGPCSWYVWFGVVLMWKCPGRGCFWNVLKPQRTVVGVACHRHGCNDYFVMLLLCGFGIVLLLSFGFLTDLL